MDLNFVKGQLALANIELVSPLTPTIYAQEILSVRCSRGHDFTIRWYNFKYGNRCRRCNIEDKIVAREKPYRDRIESEGFTWVSGEYKGLLSRLVLRCPEGHEFESCWRNWRQGNRCPICIGTQRKEYSEVKLEVEAAGYRLLSREYVNTKTKLDLVCPMGHALAMAWSKWQTGHRCLECDRENKRMAQLQQVAKLIKDDEYKLVSSYVSAQDRLHLICPSGHKYSTTWETFLKGVRCRRCGLSRPELDIARFLESLHIEYVIHDRVSLPGKSELDFFIPSKRLAIEYCGLRYHCDLFLADNYHHAKLLKCSDQNIRLITIFEDEWLHRRPQLYSRLRSILGGNKTIGARNTKATVVDATEAKKFLDSYHIQGSVNGSTHFGLRSGSGELLLLMSVGRHHRQNKGDAVITRLCGKDGYSVSGGFSKLLRFVRNTMRVGDLYTFIDLRYSDGGSYMKCGFKIAHTLAPDYSYVKQTKRYSKQSLRKTTEERTVGLTEKQLRASQGYNRIWDCGKLKLVLQADPAQSQEVHQSLMKSDQRNTEETSEEGI